jgi:predicted transcriptional regulator
MNSRSRTLSIAADIVASYVSANTIPAQDVPALIGTVFSTLHAMGNGHSVEPVAKPTPAVPIKKSVTPDYIICLEDGLSFKSLKRHLMAKYGLTPEAYRQKWGLPADYPMVAPNYAAARSKLAKDSGLGRSRAKAETVAKLVKKPKAKSSSDGAPEATSKLRAGVKANGPKPISTTKPAKAPKAPKSTSEGQG